MNQTFLSLVEGDKCQAVTEQGDITSAMTQACVGVDGNMEDIPGLPGGVRGGQRLGDPREGSQVVPEGSFCLSSAYSFLE